MAGYVTDSGYLAVGDGHELYWEDWGNPQAAPNICLHGGPGASFSDSHKSLFDPALHRVIFFDQRGCGKSKPFASTEHNTTPDLINDIELLRQKFGFKYVHMAGGSWGSTLSLLYAIAHPERVKSLLIWSILLARQFETDWVNEGYPRYNFPAEWERFIALVPVEHRTNGTTVMRYYAEKMRSSNKAEAGTYAFEWTLWEMTLVSIKYDPAQTEDEVREDENTLSTALLETHYFLSNCFLPNNFILNNIAKLRDIPCEVVQGRFDMCTPPIAAYDLARAYGARLHLQWTNSGHMRDDPGMFETLRSVAASKLI